MSNWNKDFNFSEFSVNIIKLVDSIRSVGKDGSTKPIEPRVNALYRAIGLPAVNVDETNNIDDFNNGNLHTSFTPTSSQQVKLGDRKISMHQKVTEKEVEKFLDINTSNVADSIIESSERSRGGLKPMVVDNSIPIWPLSKRVGQAFSTDDQLKKVDTKLQRPLLEAIISIRLKIENIQNTDTQNRIRFAITTAIQQLGEEILPLFKKSLRNVGELVDVTMNRIGKVRAYMSENVQAKEDGIPEENPKMLKKEDVGVIEEQVQKQEQILTQKETRLALFNFDDTFGESTSTSRNLKSSLLASDIINIILASPTSNIRENIKESKSRVKKYEADIKKAHKDIDLIFGTYSGLSGSDVLAIVTSLFEVKLDILISLLNDTGKSNLETWLGISNLSELFSVSSVTTAVTTLENTVEANLMVIQEELKKKKRRDKNRYKKE